VLTELNGVGVPEPQLTASSASIVVGSSSVAAVKSGGVDPNGHDQARDLHRRADDRIRETRSPVVSRYWLGSESTPVAPPEVPVPVKSNGATLRPASRARSTVKVPVVPCTVTVPEALVLTSRTRPALASNESAPEVSVLEVPNALMIEPIEIWAGVLITDELL
jgi:hypothetical protein